MDQTETTKVNPPNLGAGARVIRAFAPFLLPALLFQSGIFLLFCAYPILLLSLQKKSPLAALAACSNFLILYFFGNKHEAWLFFSILFLIGLILPGLIRLTSKIREAAFITLFLSLITALGALLILAKQNSAHAIDYYHQSLQRILKELATLPGSPIQPLIEQIGFDALKQELAQGLPGYFLSGAFVLIWVNLFVASAFLKGFLSKNFWLRYKTPDFFVLFFILTGCAYLFLPPTQEWISVTGIRFLSTVYAFHGICLLGFFLNRFQVAGFFRFFVTFFAVFFGGPALIVSGFFDHWFDFRRKLGQS